MNDTKEFKQYLIEARQEFSQFIANEKWNTKLRTACEDLLIAYDQAYARIKEHNTNVITNFIKINLVTYELTENGAKFYSIGERWLNAHMIARFEYNEDDRVVMITMKGEDFDDYTFAAATDLESFLNHLRWALQTPIFDVLSC